MPAELSGGSHHVHDWKRPEGGGVVIATYPEQHPYVCECGAFTHDPETGDPCRTCAPEDYAARTTDTVVLQGGPFGGAVIARPVDRQVWLRVDGPEKRAQKIVQYRRDESGAWVFYCNAWTLPLEGRDA